MSKNPWKTTSNPIGGRTVYGVYRIIDPNEIDHSGNRELFGDYVDSKEKAEAIAMLLNEEEQRMSRRK